MRASCLLTSIFGVAVAAGTCPPLGPVFPAPKTLASDSVFQASLTSIKSSIQETLLTGNSSFGPVNPNDTYSIQIFSTRDERPLLDFHRRGAGVVGNRTIDGDSVYRIASTTKLITVYLLLLQNGDGIFDDPVTKYLPELGSNSQWEGVTVGSFASYLSGITAEVFSTEIFAPSLDILLPGAFPILEPEDKPPCAYGQTGCTREVFLRYLATRRPVYLPNTGPVYSNTAFAVLGLVLESATGLTYEKSLQKLLVNPLQLKGTTSIVPSDSSHGVIVGDETRGGWNVVIDGAGTGMGAMFSTPNDMTAIGRAIMSSSLLPSNTTRAWFKPTSHTSSLIGSVGRAWEIFRAVVGPPENNRVVDLYVKSGNVAGYGAKLVLIPDYDVGFIVMMAGLAGTVADQISGIIVDQLLPALEEAARREADVTYAGTYMVGNDLNSSITLSTAAGTPGLRIDRWISNGTDLVQDLLRAPQFFQMYPTNVRDEASNKISWRSSFVASAGAGPFSACPSWFALDRPPHGAYGVDEFVFELNQRDRAISVQPKALKVTLARV